VTRRLDPDEPVIGIFGAGRSGTAVARLARAAGYQVVIAGPRPEHTARALAQTVPGVITSGVAELPQRAGLLVLAVPLHRFRELPLPLLGGHIVVDMMNYWPDVDGSLPEFEGAVKPSSVLVAEALPPTARVVKALNHLSHRQIQQLARPVGAPDRAALGICGDDPTAVESVADVVDRIGFDPVAAGDLGASAALQPGAAVFGAALDAAAMRRLLAADQFSAA
jgi:predicted dinucleotide-binding enzyme